MFTNYKPTNVWLGLECVVWGQWTINYFHYIFGDNSQWVARSKCDKFFQRVGFDTSVKWVAYNCNPDITTSDLLSFYNWHLNSSSLQKYRYSIFTAREENWRAWVYNFVCCRKMCGAYVKKRNATAQLISATASAIITHYTHVEQKQVSHYKSWS